MKLYRLGEREIRIRLTKEDLASFSVTVEELDYDSARGKKIIWELFDKARQETGFEADGEKIYIQLYPTERGGCELFVTKLEKEAKKECFCFADFDTLFTALTRSPLPSEAELWKEERRGKFFVLLPEEKTPVAFCEFGEKVKTPSHIFLNSRCKKVRWEERKTDGRKA